MKASVSVLNVWTVFEVFASMEMVVIEMVVAKAESKTEGRTSEESIRITVPVTIWVIGIGGIIRVAVVAVKLGI